MGIFQIAQGQLTPQSLVRSGRISNLSEILWMFSLPASMKQIRSKMKALEWTQHFPHYNPMGAICCHGNQSSNPTWSKTYCNQSPTPMMLQIKFDYDWPTGCGDNNNNNNNNNDFIYRGSSVGVFQSSLRSSLQQTYIHIQ